MAYTSRSLSVLGYANGFTLWHYATPDTFKQMKEPGYFNAASDMFRPGDFLLINANQMGARHNAICVIADNKNGEVTLNELSPRE